MFLAIRNTLFSRTLCKITANYPKALLKTDKIKNPFHNVKRV